MTNIEKVSTSKPKRCLVLGGRGFIGSHLVKSLLSQGYIVRCFGRPQVARLDDFYLTHSNIEIYEGDFNSEYDILSALEACDICFHLISTTLPKSSNDDPLFDVQTNIGGTVKLLQHAIKAGLKKIIFLSSGGTVYGTPTLVPIDENHPTNPICSYGITKLAIEKYLELHRNLYGLDYTVLRLSNPYGELQRVVATQGAVAVFLNKALRNESIEIWGDGSVVRDYIYISDVISALSCAVNYQGSYRIFNIGAGEGKSINEIVEAIEKAVGHPVERVYKEARSFDVPISILSTDLAAAELGWQPKTSFEQGLERMARWARQHSF